MLELEGIPHVSQHPRFRSLKSALKKRGIDVVDYIELDPDEYSRFEPHNMRIIIGEYTTYQDFLHEIKHYHDVKRAGLLGQKIIGKLSAAFDVVAYAWEIGHLEAGFSGFRPSERISLYEQYEIAYVASEKIIQRAKYSQRIRNILQSIGFLKEVNRHDATKTG